MLSSNFGLPHLRVRRKSIWFIAGGMLPIIGFVLAGFGLMSGPDDSIADTDVTRRLAQDLPGDPFDLTWIRVDGPVDDGAVNRTWIWGPAESAIEGIEPYAEAPDGERRVRYYDKSRMELTDPEGDSSSPWFVTNGLLVYELVTGRRQLGDTRFEQYEPAAVPVAGDVENNPGPTYASLGLVMGLPPNQVGERVIERVDSNGQVSTDPALADYGITAAHLVAEPGLNHSVASVFWEFLNRTGPIIEDGELTEGLLFPSPFFASGLPITEAYWTTVQVGGLQRDVLVQAFQRRVLTYTPDNPTGWQVESGNVGQHYRTWLASLGPSLPDSETSATPTVVPLPAPTATYAAPTPSPGTVSPPGIQVIEIGPGAVDAWTRSIVRDRSDRVWVVAMNNNPSYQGTGPAELNIFRATNAGVPKDFERIDQATIVAAGLADIPFADAAIDGEDRLHIVWLDRGASGEPVRYGVFDTVSLTWSLPIETIDTTGLSGFGGNAAQGGVAIGLSESGMPLIAYAASDNHVQIRVRLRTATGWSDAATPLRIDSAFVWHPALALGPGNTWTLAAYDATQRRIVSARLIDGEWSSIEIVADAVLGPENIDQGPALLVDQNGSLILSYLDANSHLRLAMRDGGDWHDVVLGGNFYTHAAGLGIFPDGTLIMAGHDEGSPPQHLNAVQGKPGDWGSWEPLVAIHADGSQVFRWSKAFSTPHPEYVDLLFFDEDTNDDGVLDDQTLYYIAVPIAS